jgi:5-deoxy-glucuronate isomerase
MKSGLISSHREGFEKGFTPVTAECDAGADFGIQVLSEGERLEETFTKESAWVLMGGKARIEWESPGFPSGAAVVTRESLFDEAPTTFHSPRGTRFRFQALSGRLEWAICRATNPKSFEPKLFLPETVVPEYRGQGLVQGACLRNVRQVFDLKARPESQLVVGEVVNFPGRWSSYPPHHHAQPEIYHYRFTLPQGYGHAESGDSVFKVKGGDTLLIPGGHDHAQVSAPGYGMYYLWVVKHLEGNPYLGFEFTDEHRWTLNPEHQGWEPRL